MFDQTKLFHLKVALPRLEGKAKSEMATKINHPSFSEDEFGQKLDRALTDTLVKAGTMSNTYYIIVNFDECFELHRKKKTNTERVD